MEMTFEQYILNPMGKKNAVMNATAREAIRSSYMKKFDAIMVRERGRIIYHLYKNTKKNKFYAHFKIPSETIDRFYYDVVLEFSATEDVKESGTNLLKYNVRFFSNDPAFVYTYAYVFSHNGLFIDELKPKMSRKALNTKAKEKNPYEQVGYVKTIYFAYLAMVNRGLNRLDRFKNEAIELDIKYLLSQITDADTKVGDREAEQAKLEKKKKKNRVPKEKSDHVNNTNNSLSIKTTKSINRTKTIDNKNVSRSKQTKRK